jgi:hypothetical protein
MNEIYARAMPAETDAPETTIAAIVAKIRQPSGLRLALADWQQLQRDYSDKMAQLRDSIAEMQNRGGEASTSAAPLTAGIVELDRQLRELRGKLQESLGAVLRERVPFTKAVSQALAPHRRQSAQRALTAASALASQLDCLAEIDNEIAAVGGAPGARPLRKSDLRPLIVKLCRIAGKKAENYDW